LIDTDWNCKDGMKTFASELKKAQRICA